MKLPTILELLQAGVHFGHQKSRWHPKMKPYVFIERNGVHIIDLEKTLEKLEAALKAAQEIVAAGGLILFIGTKKQGQAMVRKYAEACGMPFVVERWVGGMFTNFANVNKLIKKFKELKEKRESGALAKYTKKEQALFGKQIEKLEKLVGGLVNLKKIPEAIFVLDIKREKTAVTEARKKRVPVFGFCDTNINPELLDWPVPANDDAVKSIDLILALFAEAIKEAKDQSATNSVQEK